MKLYTEEQLTELLKEIFKDDFNKGADIIPIILGKELTPIEIPSDEEIQKIAIERFPVSMEDFGSEKIDGNEYFRSIFIQGIECFRDKIQGGNK